MRIAIVNDMTLALEAMRRVIVKAPGHEVAWIARDGAEAVARCAEDRPDLILMDLIMPKMDGVEATRRIMASTPCAIVVVTANVNDNSSKVFEAMGAGALDAVNTPVLGSIAVADGSKPLLNKVETIRKLLGGGGARKFFGSSEASQSQKEQSQKTLVALGASAGGPLALAKVLSALPADFDAAIVIVQHIDAQFAQGLADWLDHQSRLPVQLALPGDRPQAGRVLLAAREDHLVFESPSQLTYNSEPLDYSYRPSIDVFFKSALRAWPGEIVGVVLTGMGRDGAEGLLALRQAGHYTLVQDEATSAVYGMPKAAAQLEAAIEILPLEQIGPRLASLVSMNKVHG